MYTVVSVNVYFYLAVVLVVNCGFLYFKNWSQIPCVCSHLINKADSDVEKYQIKPDLVQTRSGVITQPTEEQLRRSQPFTTNDGCNG